MTVNTEIRIAGVPWPAYKLAALLMAALVALVVGAVTASAAPAVLIGFATGALVWICAALAARR